MQSVWSFFQHILCRFPLVKTHNTNLTEHQTRLFWDNHLWKLKGGNEERKSENLQRKTVSDLWWEGGRKGFMLQTLNESNAPGMELLIHSQLRVLYGIKYCSGTAVCSPLIQNKEKTITNLCLIAYLCILSSGSLLQSHFLPVSNLTNDLIQASVIRFSKIQQNLWLLFIIFHPYISIHF